MVEQLLTQLPAQLPVAVAVISPEGTVDYANPRLAELLDATPGELVGRRVDDVMGEPGFGKALTHAEDDAVQELRCRRADGAELWVDVTCRRMEGTEALLVVLAESTERHKLAGEDAARTALLTELAELPEKNPGPVCRLASDGTILMANAAARTFIGAGDICGRSWLELCPGMSRELWQEVLDVEPGSPVRVLHEADKDDVWILFSHVRSENGDLVFAYGADITARRRNEKLLADQAATLREMARFPEMNPGPVLRMDTDARVLMANAAARSVFGDELIGRSWRDLCPGIDTEVWDAFLAAEGAAVPHEAWIDDRAYVFAHRYDRHSGLVFVFGADVTAQKKAESALRQSERMATLGTLAAGVAHELNNPAAATRRAADQLSEAFADLEAAHRRLDAIAEEGSAREVLEELDARARSHAVRPSDLGAVERSDREAELEDWLDENDVDGAWELAPTLVSQDLDAQDLDRLLDRVGPQGLPVVLAWASSAFRVYLLTHEIGQGSARISEIVGALKSYSYLGQAPVQAVDLHEGIDNTLVILRNKLKHGIEVRREYGAVPPVAAHGSELNQVWTNLLDNAADAMDGKGTITIRTHQDGAWAVVEIVDDGPGIAASIQHKVFDPFFTTKEPGEGTGLGLSTTYSIVTERHHGTISVTSVPGETRFTVRLPIDAAGGSAR
jgi:PAS domain S-box-containing protein